MVSSSSFLFAFAFLLYLQCQFDIRVVDINGIGFDLTILIQRRKVEIGHFKHIKKNTERIFIVLGFGSYPATIQLHLFAASIYQQDF